MKLVGCFEDADDVPVSGYIYNQSLDWPIDHQTFRLS